MPKITPSKCPSCGHLLDAASCLRDDDATPSPGDCTVCSYCSHVCVFGDDLQLRHPTDQEIYDIAGAPELLETVEFVEFRRKREEEKNGVNS